ncbi:MAG: alpha/beta hydrolase [Actinomycetia bacterium]|nr:alpha/beta hydrolase [Actinomycetes bacterium]
MSYVAIPRDPVRIWYEVSGSEHGDHLTTIGGDLLAHRQFAFVNPLLEQRFRLVSWDFRGVGQSDRPVQEYSIDTKINDLLAVLDAAGVERTHLWATATGSYTAIRTAARHPERVGAVITYAQYKPEEAMWRIWNTLETAFDQFEWPEACRIVCKLFGGPAAAEGWLAEEFEKGSTAELYRLIHPAQLASDLTEELRSTTAPMLVMLGDTGPMGKHSGYARGYDGMKELRPDIELAVVAGATGTYCMIEDPEQSAAKAIEFLERHPLSSLA